MKIKNKQNRHKYTNKYTSYNKTHNKMKGGNSPLTDDLIKKIRSNDPSMTTLNLSNQKLKLIDFVNLTDILEFNKTITIIDLSNTNIDDQIAQLFGDVLMFNKIITTFNISNNNISDSGAHLLGHDLKYNKTLTTFDISNNKISAEGAQMLLNDLKKHNKTLTTININGNESEHRNIYKSKSIDKDHGQGNNISESIDFIKKHMKYKNLDETNTNESIFNEYVKRLGYTNDTFNEIIDNIYKNGYQAISKIEDSDKYIINLHGELNNKLFIIPKNINIVFLTPIRYMTCSNFNLIKTKIEILFDKYLLNPYCLEDPEIKNIFGEALIYYGGQICIDLELGRSSKKEEIMTGIHYMKKIYHKYTIEDSYKYGEGDLHGMTLSKFLETEVNKDGYKFNDPSKQYTILVRSCRESNQLKLIHEDTLVFYEQLLKRLNFKINYDYNYDKDIHKGIYTNKDIHKDIIDDMYKKCKTKKQNKIYMKTNIRHTQFQRNNIKKKGKIQSRNNSNNNININNNTILVANDNREIIIDVIKKSLKNMHMQHISVKTKSFALIFKLLGINNVKLYDKNVINADLKFKIKIIKYIFNENYVLMLEFLVYCQLQKIIYLESINNNNTNIFFLDYCFNVLPELNKLNDIELSQFKYPINLKILKFIYNKFGKRICNLGIESLDISNTKLNDDAKGLKALQFFLEDNKKLQSLNISNNMIDDEVTLALAIALEKNSTLISLDISNNKISDAGAEALVEAIKVNKTLKTLIIDGNNISGLSINKMKDSGLLVKS